MTPLQAQVSPSSLMTGLGLVKNEVPASLETVNRVWNSDASEDKATIPLKSLEPFVEDVTRQFATRHGG